MTRAIRSTSGVLVALLVSISLTCGGHKPGAATSIEVPGDVDAILERCDALWRHGDRVPAFEYIGHAVDKVGEDPRLLERYNDLAVALRRYEVALDTALRLEEADTRKSPWNQLKIAEALLHLDRPDEALPYIERAVTERSFRRHAVLELDIYDPLRKNERFKHCVALAKSNVGIGSPMPDLTVRTLDGRSIPLRSLAGKVVLIDFWATWCRPCIKELPNLRAAYAEHSDEGFEIVSLSLDAELATAVSYVKTNAMPWPIVHLKDGWQSTIVAYYGVNALPDLWLYDRNGTLRYYNLRGEELHHAIEELL
jgi:thiol-disulfide isomerase/thioredoxin